MKDRKEQIEKLKKEIKEFGKSAYHNIPNILISIFIMVSSIMIFGRNLGVLGILFLFFQISFISTSFSRIKFVKSSLILLIVGIMAGISQLNPLLMIILNFIMPFFIIMLFSDDYNVKGYFIYGLSFLLFQTTRVTSFSDVITIVLAILYGLIVSYIYNLIVSKINKKDPYKKYIDTGIESVVKRLKILSKQRLKDTTPNPLNNTLSKLNKLIYMEASRKTEVLGKKEEIYFQCVLFLKRVDKLTYLAYKNRENLTNEDYEYFYKIAKLFQKVKEEYSNMDKLEIIEMLEDFINNNSLTDTSMTYDWVYTIKKLKYIIKLQDAPKNKISLKEYAHIRIEKIKNNFNLDTIQMRFALKTSLAIGIGTIMEYFIVIKTGFANAFWVPITTYTMMMQFHEEQKRKIKNYIIGTTIGTVVFTLVFQHVPQSIALIFMTLIHALIFSAKNDILKTVIGGQLVLVMSYPIYGEIEVIFMRIALVLIAAFIAWIIDRYVLYTDNLHGLINKVNHLIRIDRSILKDLKRSIKTKDSEFKYISELLLESCLLESLIVQHEKEQKYYNDPYLANSVIRYNRNFILSAEQLINVFKIKDIEAIKNSEEYLRYIDEMDEILKIAQNNWESIYNESKKEIKLDRKVARKISDDTPYLTKHMMLCIKNIEKISYALDEDRKKIQKS